jgi:ABC-type glutathione transport system ATPase component
MIVRLGFSIVIHSNPDILVIDEILAVGDMNFQQKCMSKIGELMREGVSIILISHQMLNIQKICNKAILLKRGRVVAHGEVGEVIAEYNMQNSNSNLILEEKPKNIKNSHNISCKYFKTYNSKGEESNIFGFGEDITIEWAFNMSKPINDVVVHFSMSNGVQTYNGYVTLYDNVKIEKIDDNTRIRLVLKNVALSSGIYAASIGLWDKNFIGCYFWDYDSTGCIKINSQKKIQGLFEFEHKWEINKKIY